MSGRKIAYRKKWTPEEDVRLRELADELGTKGNWNAVGKLLGDRSAKQCRERWNNIVNPGIKKRKWTAEEDATIFALHAIHGTKWVVIASALEGRGDNDVKNRFYSTLRRQMRGSGRRDDDGAVDYGEHEEVQHHAGLASGTANPEAQPEIFIAREEYQPPVKRHRAAETASVQVAGHTNLPGSFPSASLHVHTQPFSNLNTTIPSVPHADAGILQFRRPGIIRPSSHRRAAIQVLQPPPAAYPGFMQSFEGQLHHFQPGTHGYIATNSPAILPSRSLSPPPVRHSRVQLVYEKTFSDGTIIRTPLRARKQPGSVTSGARVSTHSHGALLDSSSLEDLDLARSIDDLISDSMLSDSFAYMWSPGGAAALLDMSITPRKFSQQHLGIPGPSQRLSSATQYVEEDVTIDDGSAPHPDAQSVAIGSVTKVPVVTSPTIEVKEVKPVPLADYTAASAQQLCYMSPRGCEDYSQLAAQQAQPNLSWAFLARKPQAFAMETCVAVGHVSPHVLSSPSPQHERAFPVVKALFGPRASPTATACRTPCDEPDTTAPHPTNFNSPLISNLLCALPILTAANATMSV